MLKKLKANVFEVLYFNKVLLLLFHWGKCSHILTYGSVTLQLHAYVKENIKDLLLKNGVECTYTKTIMNILLDLYLQYWHI